MLGSYKRVDVTDGDRVYYDWEMVAPPPPKECPSAVGCLYPQHIYLMSATVVDGDLYVLSLDAYPENWRLAGNSLKRIRNSFRVARRDRRARRSQRGRARRGSGGRHVVSADGEESARVMPGIAERLVVRERVRGVWN